MLGRHPLLIHNALPLHHGNWGKITRDELDKPFTDAAFSLIKMETGINPVDTAAGFQIIRRTE
jgi:PPIC-type PPIASE domain